MLENLFSAPRAYMAALGYWTLAFNLAKHWAPCDERGG